MIAVERAPIYVAGIERSGTSLIFALLASHPNIAMTRRTNLWTHFYGQYGDLSDDRNACRCIETMMRYRRLRVLDPDEHRLREDFRKGPRTYARLFELLEEQYANRLGRPRWGDKSLNTERYTQAIIEAYPSARFIHMVRDPRDRYASSKTRWSRRRGGVGAGTAEWLASVRVAERNTCNYPDNVRVLRYEDLVTQTEPVLQSVCDFIGEPYTPTMLTFDGAPVFRDKGSNSSYGARSKGAISRDSISRYRGVLSRSEIAFIERAAANEMARFGYATDARLLTPAAQFRFVMTSLPFERGRLHAWRVREAFRDHRGRPVPSYRLVDSEVST